MKTIIKKLGYFAFCLLFGSLVACSDALDEKAYTFVSGEDLVANGSYEELIAGAYAPLNYMFQWSDFYNTVNFDCDYQTGPTWAFGTCGAGNFYENSNVNGFYNNTYICIHRSNYHSFLISQMDIPEDVKNNAMGELAFLKAWSYFCLVQFYGQVCLYKTSVSEGAPLSVPRSPVKEVYEYIIEQLKFAETAMYSTHDAAWQQGHVSRGSAKGLLAKVYCTIGSASMSAGTKITVSGGPATRLDATGTKERIPYPAKLTFDKDQVAGYEDFDSKEYYRLAMEKAKELIELKDFELYASQQELWAPSSKNGKEFMFTLQTLAGSETMSNFTATDFAGYYKENGELSSGYYIYRDHWYQLFDDTDERVTWGVMHRIPFSFNSTTNQLEYCYYPAKDSIKVRLGIDGYQTTDVLRYDAHLYGSKLQKFLQFTVPRDGRRTDFNFPFMRYAEVLLLYAEADNEYNGSPSSDAIAYVEELNTRNKSRLVSDIAKTTPWTQESFRSYILEERTREFAAEGIRRYDLLRWGIYLQTMNALGGTDENDVIKRREKRHLLLPLPAKEVNTNKFITVNNPGW